MGQLGTSGMNVNGTGQSVGDLKKVGYSDSDINGLGTSQTGMQKLLQGGTQGLAQGFKGMQQQSPMRQGSPMGPVPQAQPVDSSYFLPQRKQGPNNLAFYGGGS